MGGNSGRRERAISEQASADNRKIQEINQIQSLQAQGQQTAETDKGLSAARKAGRGRRLLMDTGGASSTIG